MAVSAIPEVRTLAKRKIVHPPITQSGILVMIPATLLKTPKKMSQHPQAYPARREAHLVRAMTPLFCEKVVLGMVVVNPERMELMASEKRPPWILSVYSSELVSRSETSKTAEMSPVGIAKS